MKRFNMTASAVLLVASFAGADAFVWTVDSPASTLTTTISATLGSTISDTETNQVAGTIGGALGLPSYSFSTIHLTAADLAYTSNPTFNLTQPFVGGVTIVGSGLGFGIPGANNLGYVPSTASPVGLDGTFAQLGNGAEGRGTLNYTGVGILGASIGSGTINLLDLSPMPVDFNGTITQSGTQLVLSVPISFDQTSVQNGIPVRAQINGTIVAKATTTANGWKADAEGSWMTAANYISTSAAHVPGAPGSPFDTAVFGPVISADRAVAVPAGVSLTPRRVIINTGAAGRAYTFGGAGTLRFASNANGDARIDSQLGVARFDVPVQLQSNTTLTAGAVDSASGSLRFAQLASANASGVVKRGLGLVSVQKLDVGSLEIAQAGVANVADGQSVSKVRSLTIASGAYFDVADGALIVDNGTAPVLSVAGNTTLAGIKLAADANWSLAGVTSTEILASEGTALGFGTKATTGLTAVDGVTISDTALVVRWTLKGDTNLDQAVNFADLLRLAQHYGTAGLWFDGDSNYDGLVNFTDLLALAQGYGSALSVEEQSQLDAAFAADFALAQSMVPEPTLLGGLAALMCVRHRR